MGTPKATSPAVIDIFTTAVNDYQQEYTSGVLATPVARAGGTVIENGFDEHVYFNAKLTQSDGLRTLRELRLKGLKSLKPGKKFGIIIWIPNFQFDKDVLS